MKKDFYHFPKPSASDWMKQIQLEGASLDPDTSLNSKLWDELQVKLFYTEDDRNPISDTASFHSMHGIPEISPRIWNNLVIVYPENPKTANPKLLEALQNGAEGLIICMDEQMPLEDLLREVLPAYIQLYFFLGKNKSGATQSIWEWVQNQPLQPNQLNGAILWSPFMEMMEGEIDADSHFDLAADLIQKWKDFPSFYPISIDFGRYTDCGGSGIQELRYGLSEVIELVDQLNQRKLNSSLIFQNIAFKSSVGQAYFPEIAKLKALRILISELATQYHLEINPESIHLIVCTSSWSHSIFAPNNNLIRQTYQAMSAILGGANALWVKNLAGKDASVQENRMARNCSTILREEAYLDKFIDPAGGAYFLDSLEREIISLVKNQLQKLEIEGGWLASFREQKIQGDIRETRNSQQVSILEKKSIQVGVNKYNSKEKTPSEVIWEEFDEKGFELKPTRASYLIELQMINSR